MLNRFKHRSDEKEMLDSPDISKELLFQNLQELDILNRRLGGHSTTIQGIKKLVNDNIKTYHIVDLGCGSGDTMIFIATWARKNGYIVKLTGIDINAAVIDYMNQHCVDYPEINGVVSDYREFLKSAEHIDIVHCSLFCHHLNDNELFELFKWFKHNLKVGFVINDLQRSRMAYYCVQIFTHIFNGSLLSKNDGPISVLRGFKVNELKSLLQKEQIDKYSISRRWAFRYLVVGQK
ncbi:MAG: methyltransferase domain-containing protein [Bacteroidales bacterium]|nr:methyltransferase domain-containing protein [Bacteroidales bacterium]